MKVKRYASQDSKFFEDYAVEIAEIDDDESLLAFIDDCLDSGELKKHTGKFFRVVIALKYALEGPKGFVHYTSIDADTMYTVARPMFEDEPDWYADFEYEIAAYAEPQDVLINAYKADPKMRGVADLVEDIINNCDSFYDQD